MQYGILGPVIINVDGAPKRAYVIEEHDLQLLLNYIRGLETAVGCKKDD